MLVHSMINQNNHSAKLVLLVSIALRIPQPISLKHVRLAIIVRWHYICCDEYPCFAGKYVSNHALGSASMNAFFVLQVNIVHILQ